MTYKAEKIVPYDSGENKATQVERMFDEIAEKYDTLNHTLSMGIDRNWRKKGILSLKDLSPRKILDVATGTGDLAIETCARLHPSEIVGIDISERMMKIGAGKVSTLGLQDIIRFEKEDCCNLSYADNTFDAVTVAFGIRNFENLDAGLKEILRVLKPGGRLMVLELSSPDRFPMKQLYSIYSRLIIPTIGKLVSKSKAAYLYLPKSISVFPQGSEMVGILKKNGYRKPVCKTFTLGVCSMYLGEKIE